MHDWPHRLLDWFAAHRRPMPWRDDPAPYRVWISEIMLQQTQIATALPYFERFVARFPDVQTLAAAPLSDVLRCWEGLGYYARARNLHRCAAQLASIPQPQWPRNATQWARLPGIGPYTAAAIASICFDESIPVVDGNVARVFGRFLALETDVRTPEGHRRIAAFLTPVIKTVHAAGDFNQAIMELGALCCRPSRPQCPLCPLRGDCRAHREGREAELPVKRPRAPTVVRQAIGVKVIRRGRFLLVRNPQRRLLGALWELPGGDFDPGQGAPETVVRPLLQAQTGLTPVAVCAHGSVAHGFTHFRLEMHLFTTGARGRTRIVDGLEARWVTTFESAVLPMSRLHRKALERLACNFNVQQPTRNVQFSNLSCKPLGS